jgi:hypothetical protein
MYDGGNVIRANRIAAKTAIFSIVPLAILLFLVMS